MRIRAYLGLFWGHMSFWKLPDDMIVILGI